MWIVYALCAAMLWGLTYVLRGEIYKQISIYSSLGITYFFFCIILLLFSHLTGRLRADIQTLSSSKTTLGYFAVAFFVLLFAEICIGLSISAKNPTLAGIVEIAYPLFIALFSFILFKQQVPLSTIVGGVIVFVGVGVIYYFNR